ncbi:MAG: hypothetical protein ACRC33_22695 [Gemmataceae bacterium]
MYVNKAPLPHTGLNIDRATLRRHLHQAVNLADMLARFTPTLKDDQAVAVLRHIAECDEMFTAVCNLAGIP